MNKKKWAYIALKIGMKILDLSDLYLVYRNKDFFSDENISAMLNRASFAVIVNDDWLDKTKEIGIAGTVFHETRHGYQETQIQFRDLVKYKESEERVKLWKKESEAYVAPTGKIDDLPYYGQDMEIDAIAFANLMTKSLFGASMAIPDAIKDRVREREDEICESLIHMGTYHLLKPEEKE